MVSAGGELVRTGSTSDPPTVKRTSLAESTLEQLRSREAQKHADTLPTRRTVENIVGCPGVYAWANDDPLAPDFQVNCDTLELGSYWNGVRQQCYSYDLGPGVFSVICGNNLGSIYACLLGSGLTGTLNPAFFNWATS